MIGARRQFLLSGLLLQAEHVEEAIRPVKDLLRLGNWALRRQSRLAKGCLLLSRGLLLEMCPIGAQSPKSDGRLATTYLHS